MDVAPGPASAPPDVSVILPCFGAARSAQRSVRELRDVLKATISGGWEIIVVDDGGGDFSPDAWSADDEVHLIRLPRNAGKGAAVRAGMLSARGSARIYTDVDLPYDPDLVPVIADYLTEGSFHMVIGDRTLPASRYRADLGWPRRALSFLSTKFIGSLVTRGFFDTQCGLKGIRGDVAELLFPLVTIDRFAFDVEVVYLALRYNCDIKRIPVRLRAGAGWSTVRPLRDAVRGGLDVLGIKVRAIRGEYDCPPLEALIREDFERRIAWSRGGGQAGGASGSAHTEGVDPKASTGRSGTR